MRARSTVELLQLPVRLRGIRLGQPVDVLVDSADWRALGFVVLCGDELQRFLPRGGLQPAVAADQGLGQPVRMVDELEGILAFHA